MTQKEAKKIIITSFSDMKLRNFSNKSIITEITSIRNKAFHDEIVYGFGDFIKALKDIRNYIEVL